uniref:Uncharacterized protein n=1 Tax=Anguilla anguilla TaxID=7936 RepID=A0A0E9RRR1_ANGAN
MNPTGGSCSLYGSGCRFTVTHTDRALWVEFELLNPCVQRHAPVSERDKW